MECEYIKGDGEKCQAMAINGDTCCFAHSMLPEIVEKRQLAKAEGGRNSRKIMLQPTEGEIPIKTIQGVVTLIERTVNDVRQNRITTSQANCIGFLCGIAMKGMEKIPPEEDENRITVSDIVAKLKRYN